MFGPNALLAVKMLSDLSDFQVGVLTRTFQYEADVLSRCRCEAGELPGPGAGMEGLAAAW